jgi:hypothetical protein
MVEQMNVKADNCTAEHLHNDNDTHYHYVRLKKNLYGDLFPFFFLI